MSASIVTGDVSKCVAVIRYEMARVNAELRYEAGDRLLFAFWRFNSGFALLGKLMWLTLQVDIRDDRVELTGPRKIVLRLKKLQQSESRAPSQGNAQE